MMYQSRDLCPTGCLKLKRKTDSREQPSDGNRDTDLLNTPKDVDIQPSERNIQYTPDWIPHKKTQQLDQH